MKADAHLSTADWTDEAIDHLRAELLARTVHTLKDERVSMKAKTDAWCWMFSNSVAPFSYKVCCEAAGVNPAELRQAIQNRLGR